MLSLLKPESLYQFLYEKLYDLVHCKIKSIAPNTLTNKESVAQEDSLNFQLKHLIYIYIYTSSIVWGGLLITTQHYWAFPRYAFFQFEGYMGVESETNLESSLFSCCFTTWMVASNKDLNCRNSFEAGLTKKKLVSRSQSFQGGPRIQ